MITPPARIGAYAPGVMSNTKPAKVLKPKRRAKATKPATMQAMPMRGLINR